MAQALRHSELHRASVAGPAYLLLFPIPVVCFLGAVITDVTYSDSAFLMWLHFSQWLIAAGLVFGAVAALVLLVEFFAGRVMRAGAVGWVHLVAFLAMLIIELFNAFVHTIDGWTAVVPTGMTLSIIGAIAAITAVATLFRVPVTWVRRDEARA